MECKQKSFILVIDSFSNILFDLFICVILKKKKKILTSPSQFYFFPLIRSITFQDIFKILFICVNMRRKKKFHHSSRIRGVNEGENS